MEGGEDVVVSVLALSVSRQKPNQSSTNAPKITAHFYLSPQIKAGAGECGVFLRHRLLHPYCTIWVCMCLCAVVCTCVRFVTVCVLFGCVCLRKSFISFLGLSAVFRDNNSSFLLP